MAVIVEVPEPTIVIVEPLFMVVTEELLLVSVIVPALLDVGAVNVNGASPKFLVIALKVPKVGALVFTVKVAVVVPEV